MSGLTAFVAQAKVTGDIGESLSKEYSAAVREVAKAEGAAAGIRDAVPKALKSVGEHVKADSEAGKFDALDAKQVEQLIFDYMRKTGECVSNFGKKRASDALAGAGIVAGLKTALELVTKRHESAVARATQIEAQQAQRVAPEVIERGALPGASKFQDRIDEASAAKKEAAIKEKRKVAAKKRRAKKKAATKKVA